MIILASIVFLFFTSFNGKCQRTLSPMAQHAIALFEESKYSEASVIFRNLITKYPNDMLYQYYYAASLIENNQKIDEALSYLISCSKKSEQADIYYYLGLAYYRKFNFSEAYQSFLKAKTLIGNNTQYARNIEYYANNFMIMLDEFKTFTPIQGSKNLIIPFDSITLYLTKYGNLHVYKVNYLKNTFISFSTQPTNFQFFTYRKNNHDNFDIYVRYYQSQNSTSPIIEPLKKQINTGQDEIFPIFDPSSSYLYFSSNRWEGLGGFEIYRSKIDTLRLKIISTERLVFPINSPWNDYIYIPSKYLFSDRESSDRKTAIYSLQSQNTIPSVSIKVEDQCFFSGPLSIIQSTPQSNKTNITHLSDKQENLNSNIFKLLLLQRSLDSLNILLQDYKKQLAIMPNNDERKRLFAKHKQLDNEIYTKQKDLNKKYINLPIYNSILSNIENKMDTDSFTFEIREVSLYNEQNPIPENFSLPEGIIYTIQLGVYSKKVKNDFFRGITPIMAEFLQDKNIIKYYAGIFRNYAAADSSLQMIRSYGFKEAFIVSFYDSQKIPLSRARDLEKRYEK